MLVFDMDGVLVDVTDSYRETIVRTVEHFTGQTISRDTIQDYKNQGGWNNDWALSQKICHDLGVDIPYATIVDYFNWLFLEQGLIHRERWLPQNGLLDRLGEKFELAIFTGRTTEEAEITLNREGLRDRFLLVTANDVEHEKPAPDGLLKIAGTAAVEETAVCRRHGRRCTLRTGRPSAICRDRRRAKPSPGRVAGAISDRRRDSGVEGHQ